MKYELTFLVNGQVVDIMTVGTPKGNIPVWAVEFIQRQVIGGATVQIKTCLT